ncbi:hypothetical protein [Phenylobacterium sp.]|uniref:hypothetical protein n=1 Tax=Phenylobacterium sp. TaxID=1871053 RepID=UPI003567D83D
MASRIAALLGTGALTALAGAAMAQTPPIWAEAPSAADVAAAYPAKAKAAAVGGQVNLSCQIEHRRPTLCAAIGEKPQGYGFGFAARQLATRLVTPDGSLNGKEVRIPFTFDPGVLSGATTVARPIWVELPAPSDFQAEFPQAANGVNDVRVVLACVLGAGGVPSNCTVEHEEPAGQGYGDGALAVAPKFRAAPWSHDGEPTVGAHVRLPIRFQLTPAKPRAAKP